MFSGEVGEGGGLFMSINGVEVGACTKKESWLRGGAPWYEAYLAWGRPSCLKLGGEGGGTPPNVAHMRGTASGGKACGDTVGRAVEGWALALGPGGDREDFYWYMNMRPQPCPEGAEERGKELRLLTIRTLEHLSEGAAVEVTPVRPYSRQTKEGDVFHIAPDYTFKVGGRVGFVVITADPYRAMFPGAVSWASRGTEPIVVHVNPEDGRVAVYDGFHERMGVLLSSLRHLHVYYATTVFRDNYLGVPEELRPRPNTFTLDTEYVRGRDLYEVGVLNLARPYASMVAFLKCKGVPGERLAQMGVSLATFDRLAMTELDAQGRFRYRVVDPAGPTPRVLFFGATQDISWLEGYLIDAPDAPAAEAARLRGGGQGGVVASNVATAAASRTPKKGIFGSDSTAADLDALYGIYAGPAMWGNKTRHRALFDALMLGEIVSGMMREK
jgi:hypothetical protein